MHNKPLGLNQSSQYIIGSTHLIAQTAASCSCLSADSRVASCYGYAWVRGPLYFSFNKEMLCVLSLCLAEKLYSFIFLFVSLLVSFLVCAFFSKAVNFFKPEETFCLLHMSFIGTQH